MYRKYFFKNKGVLSRRFVASGLAAVFSAGMFGSYAGAMNMMNVNEPFLPFGLELSFLDEIEEESEDTEKVLRFIINNKWDDLIGIGGYLSKYGDEDNKELLTDRGFVARVVAYALLSKFYKSKGKFSSIDDLLKELKSSNFQIQVLGLRTLGDQPRKFLLDKIKRGWGEKILEKLEKEKLEKEKLEKEKLEKEKSDKNIGNKTKNKFCKNIIFIFVAIILLSVIAATILAGKSKTNTGVPNNNKDDEKLNPPTDPEQNQEPKNPEQGNQEQENQDQKSSVVPNNILKVIGTTVSAGTLAGGGTYLVNKVLKCGKSSEVKNSGNVNYMYLNSNGNKVKKTEEGRKDNYDNDDKNADNSGTNQLLEDKNAEKIEEEQEEILERSALSDDTEATSDEDKNKD